MLGTEGKGVAGRAVWGGQISPCVMSTFRALSTSQGLTEREQKSFSLFLSDQKEDNETLGTRRWRYQWCQVGRVSQRLSNWPSLISPLPGEEVLPLTSFLSLSLSVSLCLSVSLSVSSQRRTKQGPRVSATKKPRKLTILPVHSSSPEALT